jgi:hypothetical protein
MANLDQLVQDAKAMSDKLNPEGAQLAAAMITASAIRNAAEHIAMAIKLSRSHQPNEGEK